MGQSQSQERGCTSAEGGALLTKQLDMYMACLFLGPSLAPSRKCYDQRSKHNTAEDYGSVPLSRSTTARETSTIPKQQITRSHEQFTWFGKDAYVHGEGESFTMNLKTITDDCRE